MPSRIRLNEPALLDHHNNALDELYYLGSLPGSQNGGALAFCAGQEHSGRHFSPYHGWAYMGNDLRCDTCRREWAEQVAYTSIGYYY